MRPIVAEEGWTWQRPGDGRPVYGADEGAPAPSLNDPEVDPTPAAKPRAPAPPSAGPPAWAMPLVGPEIAAHPHYPPPAYPPPAYPPPPPSYPPPGFAPVPGYAAPPAWPPTAQPQVPPTRPLINPAAPRSPKVRAALIAGVVGVVAGFATNLLVCLLPVAMIAGAATITLAWQAAAEARREGRTEELAPWLMALGGVVIAVPLMLAVIALILMVFFKKMMMNMLGGAGG